MGDIRLDDAGVAWQHCPACGQEVVPSYNGWARHEPYCPATHPHWCGNKTDHRRRPDSLDAAWAEAEAALPEGWTLGGVQRSNQRGQTKRQAYISTAWGGRLAGQTAVLATPRGRRIAYADTPAAALRALAAKLRG